MKDISQLLKGRVFVFMEGKKTEKMWPWACPKCAAGAEAFAQGSNLVGLSCFVRVWGENLHVLGHESSKDVYLLGALGRTRKSLPST